MGSIIKIILERLENTLYLSRRMIKSVTEIFNIDQSNQFQFFFFLIYTIKFLLNVK